MSTPLHAVETKKVTEAAFVAEVFHEEDFRIFKVDIQRSELQQIHNLGTVLVVDRHYEDARLIFTENTQYLKDSRKRVCAGIVENTTEYCAILVMVAERFATRDFMDLFKAMHQKDPQKNHELAIEQLRNLKKNNSQHFIKLSLQFGRLLLIAAIENSNIPLALQLIREEGIRPDFDLNTLAREYETITQAKPDHRLGTPLITFVIFCPKEKFFSPQGQELLSLLLFPNTAFDPTKINLVGSIMCERSHFPKPSMVVISNLLRRGLNPLLWDSRLLSIDDAGIQDLLDSFGAGLLLNTIRNNRTPENQNEIRFLSCLPGSEDVELGTVNNLVKMLTSSELDSCTTQAQQRLLCIHRSLTSVPDPKILAENVETMVKPLLSAFYQRRYVECSKPILTLFNTYSKCPGPVSQLILTFLDPTEMMLGILDGQSGKKVDDASGLVSSVDSSSSGGSGSAGAAGEPREERKAQAKKP